MFSCVSSMAENNSASHFYKYPHIVLVKI